MDPPNPLAAYLAKTNTSYAEFARVVGADRARIQRCAKGERRPGLDLALAIEEATQGAVPASYWRTGAGGGAMGSARRKGRRSKVRHARSIAAPRP
jgi:hypothetical protein